MGFFLVKYPSFLQQFYPHRLYKKEEKYTLYLTFDDGPVPEITPWVLDELKKYEAKATFFCIGDNIEKHPEIFDRILAEGHTVGNHTQKHLNGWKTPDDLYIKDAERTEKIIANRMYENDNRQGFINRNTGNTNHKYFRPPYGRIKNSQDRELTKLGYNIVMWDVLSGDFDPKTSAEGCYKNVIKNTTDGSIVVLHDSIKAANNLKEILPKIMEFFNQRDFSFKGL